MDHKIDLAYRVSVSSPEVEIRQRATGGRK
jgi:hypothetical protein